MTGRPMTSAYGAVRQVPDRRHPDGMVTTSQGCGRPGRPDPLIPYAEAPQPRRPCGGSLCPFMPASPLAVSSAADTITSRRASGPLPGRPTLPSVKESRFSLLILPAGRQSYCEMTGDSSDTSNGHALHVQQLFVRHQQTVLGYVLSIEPNFADAQDIVQEVFLAVSRKAQTWSAGTDFLAWVCTVARYETLHFQRTRARRTGRLDEDVIELLHAGEAVDESEWQHRVEALRGCLGRLAPRAKELVWRRYHGVQMPREIATAIGWTVNAVRVALTRARNTLRECMERQLNAGGQPR